jgi:hypothetical protein
MSKMHYDLKAIREKRRMSIQDIYEKTRLSEEMIRMIESGEIYTRPDANKTYLRSFSRTYARALGISDEDIVTALDYQDADMYEGFLAEKYLGAGGSGEKQAPPDDADEKKPSSDSSVAGKIRKPEGFRTGISGPPAKQSEQDKKDRPANQGDSESKRKVKSHKFPSFEPDSDFDDGDNVGDVKKLGETSGADDKDSDSSGPASTDSASIFSPAVPDSKTVSASGSTEDGPIDWADVNRKIVPVNRGNGILISFGIIGIILIAFLIYFIINLENADNDAALMPGDGSVQMLPSDTLDAPLSPDTGQLAAALPDTLRLTVYAARGNLEPVRVLSDLFNSQRPYWIETGRAMQFEFVQEIQVRGNLERMILMYEDRVFTEFQSIDPENRLIRISREQFLRDPTMQSFSSEDMPDDLPRPAEILERPQM